MLNDQIKRIEDNAIAFLNMRVKKEVVSTFDGIKAEIKEIFEYDRTALSDISLNRFTRHIVNIIKDREIDRQNADEVLLFVCKQLNMHGLVDAFNERIK